MENTKPNQDVPVLPLRDVVVYPQMVIPLFVGRNKSVKALDAAMSGDKQIFLLAQKDAVVDEPTTDNLYRVGTMATILQLLKLPDGTIKLLVEGTERAKVVKFIDHEDYFLAEVEQFQEEKLAPNEADVLIRSVLGQFEQYLKLNKKIPQEVLASLSSIDDPGRLADTIAAHMALRVEEKQAVLETISPQERLEKLLALTESEIDILQVEKRIRGRVKKQMETKGGLASFSN